MKITEAVKSGRVLVPDGAQGAFLQKKGLKPGDCRKLAATHPSCATLYKDPGFRSKKERSLGDMIEGYRKVCIKKWR